MTVAHFVDVEGSPDRFEVRTIAREDLRSSLAQGWADFMDRRGDLVFIGLIYPVVGVGAAIVALGGSLFPLLFPVAAGLGLLGPVAASGFYELSRRREDGLDSDWSHFLDVVKRPGFDGLTAVGTLLLVIFAGWMAVAAGLFVALFGYAPMTVGEFITRLFTTPEGWALILIGNAAGLVFSVLALMVSVVSMPMLIDKDVSARTALRTSIAAVSANKTMMLRWGIMVAALLVLGSIPFFVGLAVVLPVLGYATWHLYTKVVVR